MGKGEVSEEHYYEMVSQEGEEEAPDTFFSNSVFWFSDDLGVIEMFFEIQEPPLALDQVT
jgi:hypothetical protein